MQQHNESQEEVLKRFKETEDQLKRIKLSFSSYEAQEAALQEEANNMSLLVSEDEAMLSNFKRNMAAFEEYYPDIYDFFKDYEPKKHILSIKEGFANPVNVDTGRSFYEYPPYLTTKLQFEQFLKSSMLKKFNFNESTANEASFTHVECLDSIQKLVDDIKNPFDFEKRKHLCSLVVFGVGAGYHIEMLAQKYQTQCIYVLEPDLDIFYFSLFTANWLHIIETIDEKEGRLYLSLGEQKDTFFEEVIGVSGRSGRYQMSHIAGYIHYISPQIDELLNEFNSRYFEAGHGWGFFDDGVISIAHLLGNLKNKVPMVHKQAKLSVSWKDIPVFIIGNGPSLDDLVDTIKAYQDKAIIISCGSALSALYKIGIKPDYHCEQERTYPVAEKIDFYCPKEFLSGITFFAPTTVTPAAFDKFDVSFMAAKANEPSSELLFSSERGRALYEDYIYINPTVANTALSVGYAMGFKNFYLMGVDLGHKLDGHHHSVNSLYYQDNEDKGLYSFSEGTGVDIKGNFGGDFISDSFFYMSNMALSKLIKSYDDLNCFNLCDGAKIKYAEPLLPENIETHFSSLATLNKPKLIKEVFQKSVIEDNEELYEELLENLQYENFERVCEVLIELSEQPIETFADGVRYLENNTNILRMAPKIIHDLLNGTMMHIQVSLNHLLYGDKDDEAGLKRLKLGIVHFQQFLSDAPQYYRDNATSNHFLATTKWMDRLAGRENA
jgi:hypothetical protein